MVIQNRAILITKWSNFITRGDNNHKVVQYRRQMKETGEIDFGNLLLHSTLTCLATDTLPLYEFLEVEILLKSKERRNHTPNTDVSAWLVSLRNNYLELFVVFKTIFSETLTKSNGNYPLRRVIIVMLQVQLYLNHSPLWIFFFHYSSYLEIFFWKNTSERLLRQHVRVWM